MCTFLKESIIISFPVAHPKLPSFHCCSETVRSVTSVCIRTALLQSRPHYISIIPQQTTTYHSIVPQFHNFRPSAVEFFIHPHIWMPSLHTWKQSAHVNAPINLACRAECGKLPPNFSNRSSYHKLEHARDDRVPLMFLKTMHHAGAVLGWWRSPTSQRT